jgi:outer membrane biosynthesis protein TonB
MKDTKATQAYVTPLKRRRLAQALSGSMLGLWLAIGLIGCGPVQAVNTVDSAIEAIEAAEAAEAQKWATYEYWLAVRYLEKARKIVGNAQYEAAETFAKEAIDHATTAVKKSAEAKQKKIRGRVPPSTPTKAKTEPPKKSSPAVKKSKKAKKPKKTKKKRKRKKRPAKSKKGATQ